MVLLSILFWAFLIYGIVSVLLGFTSILKNQLPMRYVSLLVGIVGVFIISVIIKVDAQQVGVVTTPTGVRDESLHKTGSCPCCDC